MSWVLQRGSGGRPVRPNGSDTSTVTDVFFPRPHRGRGLGEGAGGRTRRAGESAYGGAGSREFGAGVLCWARFPLTPALSPGGGEGAVRLGSHHRVAFLALLLLLHWLLPRDLHADSLTTLAGESFSGKISLSPGAFVVTAAYRSTQRVPLADVRSVAFDRAAAVAAPAEWVAQSVGPERAPGDFTVSNGVVTVNGSGTSSSVDNGHYFVKQAVGETARLTAFVPPQVGTRGGPERYKVAGLALLGRLDAQGPAYYVFSEGGKNGLTRWRTAAGKERSKHFATSPDGVWLRLELCGQQVTALASDDGAAWRQVGAEVIGFPDLVHLGLVAVGAKKGMPVSVAFRGVDLTHEAAPAAALPQLQLRDGGVLAGRFVSADGSVVRWQALGREWQVSLVNVSRLVLDPRVSLTSKRLAADRPGALLVSGDFVDGELVAGPEGRVTISSVLFGLRSYSAEGAVAVVHLRETTGRTTEFELLCVDGSRLLVNALELRGENLAGRECNAGDFQLRLADVCELRRARQ